VQPYSSALPGHAAGTSGGWRAKAAQSAKTIFKNPRKTAGIVARFSSRFSMYL